MSIHFYSSIQPSVCYPFIFQQLIYLSIFIHPFILTFLIHPTIDNSPIHPSICFSSLHPSIFHAFSCVPLQPTIHPQTPPSIHYGPTCSSSLSSPRMAAFLQSMTSEKGSSQPLLRMTGMHAAWRAKHGHQQ